MAYQAQALDTTEPVSDTVWEISANLATYNVISGCAVTMDSGNMTLDIAAGVITHNGSTVVVAAQTNALTLVSDASNPRFSWVSLNSSGAAALVSGTAAADPAVPELGDSVSLMLVRIDANETIASNTTQIDKRVPFVQPTIGDAARIFVEDDTTTHLAILGGYPTGTSPANHVPVGLGWAISQAGTGNIEESGEVGDWNPTTGTTSGSDAGVKGPQIDATDGFVYIIRAKPETNASMNVVMGYHRDSADFSDGNDIIQWRVANTGNIIGVSDSGGSESTADTGVAPDGSTAHILLIECTARTSITFSRNGTAVGSAITTNIPAAAMTAVAGISTQTTVDHDLFFSDVACWRIPA
jgi:hypothetical protein